MWKKFLWSLYVSQIEGVEYIYDSHGQTFLSTLYSTLFLIIFILFYFFLLIFDE